MSTRRTLRKCAGGQVVFFGGGCLDFSCGTAVMGILNVTEDSFSDGGEFFDTGRAIERGFEMVEAGAAIIDVGAESTRPGSKAVSAEQQICRAIPVIKGLRKRTGAAISIDTYDYEVARAALEAGANIVNDISGLRDERIGELVSEFGAGIVLMHMQGTPATMQNRPVYGDVVGEVLDFLVERARLAERLGVARERIFIDPGIGFGKTLEHNLGLLRNIGKFVDSGWRVLVGASRKRFIGTLTGRDRPVDRVFGTAGSVALCAGQGVSVVRVHDVGEMVDVVKVAGAIVGVDGGGEEK